jgi:hypothetical protein
MSRIKENAQVIIVIKKKTYFRLSNRLPITPIIVIIFKSKVVRLATKATLM